MSPFSGLIGMLGMVGRLIAMPFQRLAAFMSQTRMLNPLPILRQFGRSVSAPFRSLGAMLGIKGGVKLGRFFDFEGWREALFARDSVERRRRVGLVTQFSQVHLIRMADGVRHILHIGTGIGRGAAELALPADDGRAVLRFDRGDLPSSLEAVQVRALTQHGVQHNGAALTAGALVRHGDRLHVAGREYRFEMYAWERVPLVTRVEASYATHSGPHRETNEDAIGIYQHDKAYLFALADGVGGGEAGDQVSAYAVQYLLAAFHKNARYSLPWLTVLETAFAHINAEVRAFSRRTPLPVGTTLTAMVIKDFQAYIAHVGDSRALLWRDGALRQLTTDHVQRQPVMLETRIAYELQEPHPLRDVLTRAIGKTDRLDAELLSVALRPDDVLLLLSDGVYDTLPQPDIVATLREVTPMHAAGTLVNRAVSRGAKDNASAVVVHVLPEPFVKDTWRAETDGRIFAGWQSGWPVKLRRTTDPITRYPLDGRMVLLWVGFGALLWVIIRVLGGVG